MRTSGRFAICALVVTAFLAGCSKGSQGGGPLGNQPSTFPVYSPSSVSSVGKYDDSEAITKLGSGFFGTGADEYKPYIGTQELIKTSASLDELDAWLKKLVQSPPQNLSPSERTVATELGTQSPGPSPSATAESDRWADTYKLFGLVPSAFWSKDRGRVVMLIVFDPKKVADHMGPTMDLLDQYEKMPGIIRGGIDATIKKQVGFSVSDLMNTNTPMGMIVYAARNWKNDNTRAIILVDALRGPNALPTPHNT